MEQKIKPGKIQMLNNFISILGLVKHCVKI